MTFNETDVTATCCKLDGTPISVVCGRGYSCAALCFSEEASLCPSDNCDSCDDLEEKPQTNGRSYVTRPSSKLSHCTRNGCKVRGRFKACCFHPRCAKRRQMQCSWLNYLVGKFELPVWKRLTRTKNSGHKCTRPGDIPNGRWYCEEQEIPIPETADLNGDLETYPGAVELKKFPFIIFSPQPINVAWIVMLATFLTFHQLSLAWRGVMTHRWKNWHSFDFIVWKHFTSNFVSVLWFYWILTAWTFGGFTLSDAGEGQTLPSWSFFAYPQIHSEMI